MNIKPCPYCKNFHEESSESFVECNTDNFPNGQAVQCDYCGLRGMAADQLDGDEMAIRLWNDLVNAVEMYENKQ